MGRPDQDGANAIGRWRWRVTLLSWYFLLHGRFGTVPLQMHLCDQGIALQSHRHGIVSLIDIDGHMMGQNF
jgi:hypothetical protein